MIKMPSLLKKLKSRVSVLGQGIDYYETLERDRGYLTTDQQTSYIINVARLNELNEIVRLIEESGK